MGLILGAFLVLSTRKNKGKKNEKNPKGLGNLTYLLVHLALRLMYVVDFVERKKKLVRPMVTQTK